MAYIPISPQQGPDDIPPVDYFPEAATATFKAGAPLIRNAAGFVEECGAAPGSILGFAAHDGQNLTVAGTAKCALYRAFPGRKFEANLLTAGLTQTMAGENYGLVKGGDGIWYVDANDAADQVTVDGWSSRVAIGDVNPVVDITVNEANIQEI